MNKVVINKNLLNKYIEDAFRETALQLSNEYTKIISEVGAFNDYPDSDIVDMGVLRASQSVTFEGKNARFTWGVNYALAVHEGYTRKNGNIVIGRPWTALGIQRFNFNEMFSLNLAKRLS